MVVLHTKLLVPSYTAARVARPRLAASVGRRLDEGAVLVVAPPGYGKTVLMADVAEAAGRPVAWLQLDDTDNDSATLVAALAEASRRTFPALRDAFEGLDDGDGGGGPERRFAILVNAFLDAPVGEWTLVLDDVHLLTNPEALRVIERLVDVPPPGMHLLMASRATPMLPVPRWMARGTVRRVDVNELRFTEDEAAAWLRRDLPGLSDAVVARLVERTEGWGAGLQLAKELVADDAGRPAAAPTAQRGGRAGSTSDGAEDAALELAARLTGSHPAVGGYLMDEVFARLPGDARRFLLDTSILPQLDAGGCAVVAWDGAADPGRCEAMLASLTRGPTFVQRLDAGGRWYRCHPLFREFLLERLERRERDRAARLRRRAARAAEDAGDVEAAIGFALDADADAEAVRLLEAHGDDILRRGSGEALQRWLARAGAAAGASPALQVLAGRVHRQAGQLHAASAAFQRAEEHPDAGPALRCVARTELAGIARSQGDYGRAGDWAERACDGATTDVPPQVRAGAWMERAKCEGHLGGMEHGRRLAERALRELEGAEAVDPRVRAALLGSLGQICWWHGDVDAAVRHLRRALDGLGDADTLRAADVRLALASPMLYSHDHAQARSYAERALAAYLRSEAKDRLPAAYAVLGNVRIRAGDLERAETLLRTAIALSREIGGASYDQLMAAGYLAYVLDLQGRADEAVQVAEEALWPHEGVPVVYEAYVCRSVLADCYLSAGREPEAERIYERLIEVGEERQYRIPLALAHFGRAYLALRRGDRENGTAWARRSLEILAPTHAWQLVADQGERARAVVEAVRPWRPNDGFLDRVEAHLTAAPGRAGDAPSDASARGARADAKDPDEDAFARADVEVDALGELAVRVNGEVVPRSAFASAKAFELLAYLILHRTESVTIDRALEALWPGEPNRAKTAFHTALYRLRGALRRGDDDATKFVLVQAGHYRLDAARFDVDVDRFETLVSQAREAPQERRVTLLEAALTLVRGELLAGLDRGWVELERRRLADTVRDARMGLADAHLVAGRGARALAVAREAIAADPLDEHAYLLEMRAHRAAGDVAGIERAFRKLTNVLGAELGVRPAPETERAYRRLTGREG